MSIFIPAPPAESSIEVKDGQRVHVQARNLRKSDVIKLMELLEGIADAL